MEALADDRVRRRARHVVTEIARVTETVAALEAGDWDEVGRLFVASHVSMRDDFEISCPELDAAVVVAVEAGAVGGPDDRRRLRRLQVASCPTDRVDAVVRAIDTAFVRKGFAAPGHLVAEPAGRADLRE